MNTESYGRDKYSVNIIGNTSYGIPVSNVYSTKSEMGYLKLEVPDIVLPGPSFSRRIQL